MIRSKWMKWVAAAALGVATLPAMALTVLPAPAEKKNEVKHVERKATPSRVAPHTAQPKPAAVRLGTTTTPAVASKKAVTTAKTPAKKLNGTTKKPVARHATTGRKAPSTQPAKKGLSFSTVTTKKAEARTPAKASEPRTLPLKTRAQKNGTAKPLPQIY
jgi:hypothetical protein